ncbi:MAG TPA: SAM-dependent methyltransferase [Candidatus Limnocylindrales bacterium]|nr:SAM-dependent methyltransferase [Candidatus Limnocylindrales bacterium]
MDQPDWAPESIDTERPTAARVYDYLLGGSHNFAADRDMAHKAMIMMPDLVLQAQANRAFLSRAVSYLVDAGVRQFLDIGSGIPTRGNVHEVAQKGAPDSRVVYVDIDPIAVSHSRQILRGNDQATVIQEDLRNAEAILDHADVQAMLDFEKPVALLLVAVLHVIPDADDPHAIVARLRDRLAPGSYLAIGHGTHDSRPLESKELSQLSKGTATSLAPRPLSEVERFFTGFTLVDPGVVWAPLWRPESSDEVPDNPADSSNYAGVGRKP